MVRQLGGAFDYSPEELETGLSPESKALVESAYEGIDRQNLRDYHVHILGVGAGGTGAEINPRLTSWRHPIERFHSSIYMSSMGVDDVSNADPQFLARLLSLIEHGTGGKYNILALDRNYRPDGSVNRDETEFYVPNEYVMALANEYPDIFVPLVSVHPYRKDAIEELTRWAEDGARYVKWLPNAQGIDPAEPCCDEFYKVMAKHEMALLTHTGKELAVKARAAQEWGNPLRLRRPLDHGIKVIMAHSGSLGTSQDLDHPGKRTKNFDLVIRMLEDPKYNDLLFADISAMTQINRLSKPILTLLDREDLHPRIVNGSDYPLPAVNCLIWTGKLKRLGMITADERKQLKEIYHYNPLLFDFVLKRTMRHPKSNRQFPAPVFQANPALP